MSIKYKYQVSTKFNSLQCTNDNKKTKSIIPKTGCVCAISARNPKLQNNNNI